MDGNSLQPAILQLAHERSLAGVIRHIVESLCEQRNVALARIWMIDKKTPCDDEEEQPGVLRLVASDGGAL